MICMKITCINLEEMTKMKSYKLPALKREKAVTFQGVPEQDYKDTILADMSAARESADKLELLVDEKYWPFPVYADLLFSE